MGLKKFSGTIGKKVQSGTVTSSSAVSSFQYVGSATTINFNLVTVSGLTFKPTTIIVSSSTNESNTTYKENGYTYKNTATLSSAGTTSAGSCFSLKGDLSPASVTGTGFSLPVTSASVVYNWVAFE